MRYTYGGNKRIPLVPICVCEGIEDRRNRIYEQLYRYPVYKQVGYWLGYHIGKVFHISGVGEQFYKPVCHDSHNVM